MLIITGNPGVGKNTIAKIVAKHLSLNLIDINSIALKNRAKKSKGSSGYVVDMRKLSSLLRKYVDKKNLMIGHLVPYVLQRSDVCMAAVIRRSPYELKNVYKQRGYSAQKAVDNLSSEIIGVCMYDTIKKFGKNKVAEFDNTAVKPKATAYKIISAFKGKSKYSFGKIDWLSLVVANNDTQKFFEYKMKVPLK